MDGGPNKQKDIMYFAGCWVAFNFGCDHLFILRFSVCNNAEVLHPLQLVAALNHRDVGNAVGLAEGVADDGRTRRPTAARHRHRAHTALRASERK